MRDKLKMPSRRSWLSYAIDNNTRALGRKVSDEFTVPLCRGHHREVHRCSDEAAWWIKTAIDPSAAARVLWLKSHPLLSTIGQTASGPQNMAVIARADDG